MKLTTAAIGLFIWVQFAIGALVVERRTGTYDPSHCGSTNRRTNGEPCNHGSDCCSGRCGNSQCVGSPTAPDSPPQHSHMPEMFGAPDSNSA
ncbi:unnamed protein product [Zymoseptoria tritici ST99CH_1A5]|uniref:WAP domain-containing protein n=1 Tax=Zymoseptoria tritici ST99CH_1A5 TaxID=1276529 RepID=A0A1Y6LPI9_ZYMTR|nr:unnamed protein product [Zymoseptoria tritici ST99CH_1A5]